MILRKISLVLLVIIFLTAGWNNLAQYAIQLLVGLVLVGTCLGALYDYSLSPDSESSNIAWLYMPAGAYCAFVENLVVMRGIVVIAFMISAIPTLIVLVVEFARAVKRGVFRWQNISSW